MLHRKLRDVFSLVCTLGNCNFESTLVWKYSQKHSNFLAGADFYKITAAEDQIPWSCMHPSCFPGTPSQFAQHVNLQPLNVTATLHTPFPTVRMYIYTHSIHKSCFIKSTSLEVSIYQHASLYTIEPFTLASKNRNLSYIRVFRGKLLGNYP